MNPDWSRHTNHPVRKGAEVPVDEEKPEEGRKIYFKFLASKKPREVPLGYYECSRDRTRVLTRHWSCYPGSAVDATAFVQRQSSVNPNVGNKSGCFLVEGRTRRRSPCQQSQERGGEPRGAEAARRRRWCGAPASLPGAAPPAAAPASPPRPSPSHPSGSHWTPWIGKGAKQDSYPLPALTLVRSGVRDLPPPRDSRTQPAYTCVVFCTAILSRSEWTEFRL